MSLQQNDKALVDAAFGKLRKSFSEPVSTVAAAARMSSGQVITAMNFKHYAHVVCAEMAALDVIQNTDAGVPELIVSTRYINGKEEVINSCGRCRQVLADTFPDVKFIVNEEDDLIVCDVPAMLPHTYIHYPGGKK